MEHRGVCYLIREKTGGRGVFDAPDLERKKRYCWVKSVGRSEYYNADNVGLQPELIIKLARDREYQNELTLEYEGKIYNVIRPYVTSDGGIELTIQRSDVNA